jgi:DNA-binding MurR/RpiR family transcriptional regulator
MPPQHVLGTLQSRLDTLPPSWKRLADFLLTNLDRAAFLTASDFARHSQTSESSVVRFARGLGYAGYPELREDLRVLLREKLRPVERMVQAGGVPSATASVVARVFELAIGNIQETRKLLENRLLEAAVVAITEADAKHIVGLNASAGTACLLAHHLGKILPNVRGHADGGPMLFDALLSISKRDVVIGISYPRYAKSTVEILRYARARGAQTIVFTDSQLSPAAQVADIPLVARVDSITFGNSYAGPSVVVDALVALVFRKMRQPALARLNDIDRIVKEESFFYGARAHEASAGPAERAEEPAGSRRNPRDGLSTARAAARLKGRRSGRMKP